jgi:hypothetical protein
VSDPPLIVPADELVGKADAREHEERMGDLMEAYRKSLDPSRRSWSPDFAYAGMAEKLSVWAASVSGQWA